MKIQHLSKPNPPAPPAPPAPPPIPPRDPRRRSPIFIPLPKSVRYLPSRTRLLVGIAFIAWGTIGIFVTNRAEKKFGLEPSETEKEKLGELLPRIELVERKK